MRMRAAFDGAKFIHVVARERASADASQLHSWTVESCMGPDRVKSVAKDELGAFVGAVLLVDGRVTEIGGDGIRHEYAADADATGVAFPRQLDDAAQHAMADFLESWVAPRTADDAPTWFIDAIARGVWRGRESAATGDCLVFEDAHALPNRHVTHTIRVDAATMLPRSITTTGRDVSGERSLVREYERFEVFASDPGWVWSLDDV